LFRFFARWRAVKWKIKSCFHVRSEICTKETNNSTNTREAFCPKSFNHLTTITKWCTHKRERREVEKEQENNLHITHATEIQLIFIHKNHTWISQTIKQEAKMLYKWICTRWRKDHRINECYFSLTINTIILQIRLML